MTLHLDHHGALVPPAVRDDDSYGDCCIGAAMFGNSRCTCWEPVYDLDQQSLANGGEPPEEVATRAKCCHDCAYRNGSPERSDEAEEERLLDIARSDGRQEFWCHQGVRRVVAFRHPDGRELPAGEGDYRPPLGPEERPVIWKADGTPGERCAGWAAHGASRASEPAWQILYHVPRSQVWEGSRGRQQGHAHLHATKSITIGRIHREPGAFSSALCGRSGWYTRPAETDEKRCPRCVARAERYGIAWPEPSEAPGA